MRYAQVIFAGNYAAKYDFKTDIPDLKIDDPVVCATVRGYSVGKVIALPEKSTKATNWIIQKVDVERHKSLLKAEKSWKEFEEMLR
jgi:hypothetical protein